MMEPNEIQCPTCHADVDEPCDPSSPVRFDGEHHASRIRHAAQRDASEHDRLKVVQSPGGGYQVVGNERALAMAGKPFVNWYFHKRSNARLVAVTLNTAILADAMFAAAQDEEEVAAPA